MSSLPVTSLNFVRSPDGRHFLASGSVDTTVCLWDVQLLSVVLSVRKSIAKESRQLSDEIPSWSPEVGKPCFSNGKHVATIRLRNSGACGLAISPDGTRVAVVFEWMSNIGVYSLPDGAQQAEFGSKGRGPGQFDRPRKVCFSPQNSNNILICEYNNRRVQVRPISRSP